MCFGTEQQRVWTQVKVLHEFIDAFSQGETKRHTTLLASLPYHQQQQVIHGDLRHMQSESLTDAKPTVEQCENQQVQMT